MSIEKKNAAEYAIKFIDNGMIVGLGSGSTVYEFLKLLSIKVKEGLKIKCVSTSFDTTIKAEQMGINIVPFESVDRIDISIDGADVVTKNALLKGGGGACTREKIINYFAEKFIVIADESKVKEELRGLVVIEILPFAYKNILKKYKNGKIRMSEKKLGPVISDNGNFLIDVEMNVKNPAEMEKEINNIPGVLENGIFSKCDKIIIGTKESIKIFK